MILLYRAKGKTPWQNDCNFARLRRRRHLPVKLAPQPVTKVLNWQKPQCSCHWFKRLKTMWEWRISIGWSRMGRIDCRDIAIQVSFDGGNVCPDSKWLWEQGQFCLRHTTYYIVLGRIYCFINAWSLRHPNVCGIYRTKIKTHHRKKTAVWLDGATFKWVQMVILVWLGAFKKRFL